MQENHNPLGKSNYLSIKHLERYRFVASNFYLRSKFLNIVLETDYGIAILSTSGYNVESKAL